MNKKGFNNRLRELRQEMEMTQAEMAEVLDISRQSLSNLEKGQYRPSFDLILELENFFELPIREIFNKNINNNKQAPRRQGFAGQAPRRQGSEGQAPRRQGSEGQGGKMNEQFSPFFDLNRMFEDSFGSGSSTSFPKVNVYLDNSDVVVEAEVPGLSKDDLEINVTRNAVNIKGEKKEEREVKEENIYQKESSFGSFSRTVSLPTEVQDEKAKAKIKNGRLKITVPAVRKVKKSKGLEIEEEN
jgi:HSP20 family protein